MPSMAMGRSAGLVKSRREYVLYRFWKRRIFSPCEVALMRLGKLGSPRKAARLLLAAHAERLSVSSRLVLCLAGYVLSFLGRIA